MDLPDRILYVCHDGDLYGSQQSLSLIVKHLPPMAYRPFVSIARPGPLQALLQKQSNVTVLSHRRLQWVKHDPRNAWQRIGDVLTLLVSLLPRTLRLFSIIRREKINVVHTNSAVSPEGALAAALAGVPHVWHIRELFMEKSPKFHMVLGRRISRWIIDRFSDQVICISRAVRDQFGTYAGHDPDKYRVIHNALEIPEPSAQTLKPLDDPERVIARSLSLRSLHLPDTRIFRLGYIGRLSEGKGFHDVVSAMTLLKRRELPVEVLVAGQFVDEAYRERLTGMIQDEGLVRSIHMLGYLEDLTPVYETVDLLVVPSRNEPFGRVVIEAMLQGIPCIGADSGGIPEIVESGVTGLLYPPGDVHALVGLIERLMEAAGERETIRQNARRMVCDRFNMEGQIRILDACYQSVIARHQLY